MHILRPNKRLKKEKVNMFPYKRQPIFSRRVLSSVLSVFMILALLGAEISPALAAVADELILSGSEQTGSLLSNSSPPEPDGPASKKIKTTAGEPQVLPEAQTSAWAKAVADGLAEVDEPDYAFPEQVQGKREVMEQRTADSATFDMGDGSYVLLQESHPLHYRDAAGQWRRIDPAFEPATGGWINTRNAIHSSVGEKSSAARVTLGGAGVGWEPIQLALVNGQGLRTSLALPQSAASQAGSSLGPDGRSVVYSGGWSDASLQETWRSDYGSLEYSLRLAQQPALPFGTLTGPGSGLELQVRLRLLPGFRLYVDGKPVDWTKLPQEIHAPLALVDAQGQTLLLQPPVIYEQERPALRSAGSYFLRAGGDPSTYELGVRVPWAWLAAAERQYPLVLDPLFQMKSYSTMRTYLYWPNIDTPIGSVGPGIGGFADGQERMMVKFNLPQQPIGTILQQAYLVATPNVPGDYSPSAATETVLAYQLTNDNWLNSADVVHQNSAIEIEPGVSHVMSYNPADPANGPSTSAVWDVTALVNAWRSDYTSNHGILLRTQREFCDACMGFYLNGEGWNDKDLEAIATESTPDSPKLDFPGSSRGGVRLLVYYQADSLAKNTIYETGTHPFYMYDGTPSTRAPYWGADHEFNISDTSSKWEALYVRGLNVGDGPIVPSEADPGPYTRQLMGSMKMDVLNLSGAELAASDSTQGQTDFLLLDGYQAAGSDYRLRVQTNGSAPTNYAVGRMNQLASLSTQGIPPEGGSVTSEYIFSSETAMGLWDIRTPAGWTSRVDITFLQDNFAGIYGDNLDTYYNQYVTDFHAWWVPGGGQAISKPGTRQLNTNANTSVDEDTNSYHLYADLPREGGYFALALTNSQPVVKYYTPDMWDLICPPSRGPSALPCNAVPLTQQYKVQVRLTTCPTGTIPTADGKCPKIKCPSNADKNVAYLRNKEGLSLWSFEGWSADDGASIATSTFTGAYVPMIAPNDGTEYAPTIMILGTITYGTTSHVVQTSTNSEIRLIDCDTLASPKPGVTSDDYLSVYSGRIRRTSADNYFYTATGGVTPAGNPLFSPWDADDQQMLSNLGFYIDAESSQPPGPNKDPYAGRAYSAARLSRLLAGDIVDNDYPLSVDVNWSIDVSGWLGLQKTVAAASTSQPVIASLTLDPGNTFDLDQALDIIATRDVAPRFTALRASDATVTLPDNMGGDSEPVVALILPANQAIQHAGEEVEDPQPCPDKNCVDLRALNDTLQSPQYDWQLPDIHITGPANMVTVSQPGSLQVYSTDHPYAQSGDPKDPYLDENFSFDAFKAQVRVVREKCGGIGDVVTVVYGQTQMAFPNIGDATQPGGFVAAGFKLCQDQLRGVNFAFYYAPGIPLGNSGLAMTGMSGDITINPDFTQVIFTMDLQTVDGYLWKGSGTVTMDTRGYFEFASTGKIIGLLDATSKLWVSWSPMDVGLEAGISYGGWLSGNARAHMWVGRGWQDRYSWLPANDEEHLSASVSAQITIGQGDIFEWWFIDIPPDDIVLGIEIAFGQFCTNSTCSTYEWGVKGALNILGYHIGLYYGFDHGFDFILGNDGHTLIDQYGGGKAMAGGQAAEQAGQTPSAPTLRRAPALVDGSATITFMVSADTQNLLVGLSWLEGSPQIDVRDPSGHSVIGNPDYTIAISNTQNSLLQGIQLSKPAAGEWKAVISNVTEQTDYRFIHFSDKGAPGDDRQSDGTGRFLKPALMGEDGTGSYNIQWEVPAGTPISATIGLYYVKTFIKPHGEYLGEVKIPIVKNLPFTAGSYTWDTSVMETGLYYLYAEVDDGVNDFPAGEISNPDNYCNTARSSLPPERAFSAERFPGVVRFESGGSLQITDTEAPPAPTGLELAGAAGALLARWDASTTRDVVAYQVRWGRQRYAMPGGWTWTSYQELRLTATAEPSARLNGVEEATLIYRNAVAVRAIDASDNLSDWSPVVSANPSTEPEAQVPAAPVSISVFGRTSTSISLQWFPGTGPTPASYQVIYRNIGTGEMSAVEATLWNVGITGLETGATYQFWVNAANAEGLRSASSEVSEYVITDGVDNDGDGIPDDWEAANNLLSANMFGDADQDYRTNYQEYLAGTDPNNQDSDDDGFSDGEEAEQDTDPLNGNQHPILPLYPRLALSTYTLRFHARLGNPPPGTEALSYQNTGAGSMALKAVSSAPWIMAYVTPSSTGGYIEVGVNGSGLQPGFYSGILSLTPDLENGDPIIGGQQCVRVELWLAPQDATQWVTPIYLPFVMK